MAGEHDDDDDNPSLAYRKPASIAESIEAPIGWRKPSSKVLGALARLSSAKTGTPEPSPREDEPKQITRVIGDVRRRLLRCTDGHQLFRQREFTAARQRYELWLASAKFRSCDEFDLLEVCAMLAVLRQWDSQHDEAERALERALNVPVIHYPPDAPLEGALRLAGALRDLSMPTNSQRMLADRTVATPEQQALLLRARADGALGRGETAEALELATSALARWNDLVSSGHREHIATRLTIARVHVEAERFTTADEQLRMIVRSEDQHVDSMLTARAWATAAELLLARGGRPHAALLTAVRLVGLPPPLVSNAPVHRTCARVFEAIGKTDPAREQRQELAKIESRYRACLTAELR